MRIAYIDESESDIKYFIRKFSSDPIEIIAIIPRASLDDTCNEILENHVDAIVTDFDLMEQSPTIKYDGSDLVNKFLEKQEGFPVFILTSYEDKAISYSGDVNIIYEKEELNADGGKKFLKKVKAQIEKYKLKLEADEQRLLELIAESKERKLNAFEKEELAKLDSKIEQALDRESRIPNILKDDKETSELAELLKKVDKLAESLGKNYE